MSVLHDFFRPFVSGFSEGLGVAVFGLVAWKALWKRMKQLWFGARAMLNSDILAKDPEYAHFCCEREAKRLSKKTGMPEDVFYTPEEREQVAKAIEDKNAGRPWTLWGKQYNAGE